MTLPGYNFGAVLCLEYLLARKNAPAGVVVGADVSTFGAGKEVTGKMVSDHLVVNQGVLVH